jgi:UDP-2,3-diacylglucosamine hydrolase
LAFISDLHLGPDTPRTQAALLAALPGLQADALFVLGDLFEAWVGDDALSQPFAQATAAALRALPCPVFFQHGNRDFLLGTAMAEACGFQLLDEVCTLQAFGQPWLLVHGDAQCVDDAPYQAFRTQVRASAWQAAFLARPLAERLALAAQMRDASQSSQQARQGMGLPFADPDTSVCRQLLQVAGAHTLIHGHTHRPGRFDLGDGLARVVLSDWDADHGPSPRAEVLWLSAAGIERQTL